MPLDALLLALAAAGLHAGWNLVLAREPDAEAATAVMFTVALVVWAPVAAVTWDVDAAAIPYVVASAALELAYLVLLATAYRRAELSVVYPVARGLAPVLVLAAAVAILGSDPSLGEVGGVVLVAGGIAAVRGGAARAGGPGVGYGIAIAACIAGYTLVDSRGIDHADAVAYLELVMIVPTLAYLAGVVAVKGAGAVRAAVRVRTVTAGVATFGAFLLALLALRDAPPASVAAVRETSVVIAVALAAPLLRERVGPLRLGGAALVVVGVALVATG